MQNDSINYIEFPATDIEETKRFYGGLFGWQFIDYGPNYVSFQGAGIDGGFTTDNAIAASGGVLVVLYNDQLERLEPKITEHGGKITRPIFQFPGGRRFHFLDPNGNELAVWAE